MKAVGTFGAGCFWGVEKRLREIPGVLDAEVGYMGGHLDEPSYELVCGGQTGHTEVCQVQFNPEVLSYEQLLRAFFALHDPTQVNRQGVDVGWQYRSVIFVHDEEQRRIAEEVRAALTASQHYALPIATSIEPAARFWRAEEYHQQYLVRTGATCAVGHG